MASLNKSVDELRVSVLGYIVLHVDEVIEDLEGDLLELGLVVAGGPHRGHDNVDGFTCDLNCIIIE